MQAQPPHPPPSKVGPTALGGLSILFWSTTIACSRSLTEQLGPLTSGATVYLAAGVIACGVLAGRGRLLPGLRHADRRYLFGCGGLMAVYTLLLYVAVGLARTREQVITVTVANYLWPGLTLLLAVPLLGWRARPIFLVVGTILGLAGVALAVGADGIQGSARLSWSVHAATTFPALLAAIAWALYSNLSRRWAAQAAAGAMPLFLLATGIVLLVARLFFPEHSDWTGHVFWEAAYMVCFPTLLAYVFWDNAARRGDLSLVAALSYLTPLLSVMVSAVYLGVAIKPLQWLAGALVVAGAVLCKRSIRTSSAEH